jgi:putative aldouronate transport system permease protein
MFLMVSVPNKDKSLAIEKRKRYWRKIGYRLGNDWQIYVLLVPALAYFFVWNYLPLYGIQIAFRDFKAVFGITGSEWVGFYHFKEFFNSYYFVRLLKNTFLLNFYGLIWGFPIPVILALLLNQIRFRRFKRFTQTVIYIPHFISTVVLAGMIYIFFSPSSGIINRLAVALGGKSIYYMIEPGWFRPLFIGSAIWQDAGWGTILYIAALTGIDPQIYEAATIDGANKMQKIWYIDIPSLIPIATMVLILSFGRLLTSNTQKALLLQTPGNIETSDIIGVYVYNIGLGKAMYSYTAAIGLFLNLINFVMIVTVNSIAKRVGDTALF